MADLLRLLAIFIVFFLPATLFGQDFDIYVSDAGNFDNPPWQILKFDQNGENPEVFINQNLAWPQDILFLEGSNTVLVSNFNTNRISRYNAETGAFIDEFATDIAAPTRMKIGADGLLYVLQWKGNGKVRRYQLDGTYLGEFTSVGVPQSIGLDWDSAGNLYVSSYNGDSVRKFDSAGADLGMFINTNLLGPTNIWFDTNHDLLVSDYDGGAIKRFDSTGAYLGNYIQGVGQTEGFAYLPNGNLLIGNGATSAVKMYDGSGVFIRDLIASGAGNLKTPNAVVIRTRGSGFQINSGLNDAWSNRDTRGQGFFVNVFPNIGKIFLGWFTYDTERPQASVPSMLGEPGHRWLTAFGDYSGNGAVLDIEFTQGGIFDAAIPAPTQGPDGTITLEFSSCTEATVTYDITSVNRQGVIPIRRIALDNVALCESLAAQAR